LKKISKTFKQSALKRLSNAKSCHVKNTKKTNSQRQEPNKQHYCFRERRNLSKEPPLYYSDLLDDSGDELYKPNRKDINSSDSEITSERNTSSEAESVTNIRLVKPKEKHRDKI
jgi:hypothetical protein